MPKKRSDDVRSAEENVAPSPVNVNETMSKLSSIVDKLCKSYLYNLIHDKFISA